MTIRYKQPDHKNALSLIESAKKEMEFTLAMEISESSGTTIGRNIYECFRMLGDALLTSKGRIVQDHAEQVKSLGELNVKTSRPLGALDNLRILRHSINYYGYRPNLEEVRDAVNLAKSLFEPICKEVLRQIRLGEKLAGLSMGGEGEE
jgi:hypothetical protein